MRPTGTGWVPPTAVDTLEYLHAGDTAIVSMQYSYVPSWLTILVEPNRSIDAAQTLFDAIYAGGFVLDKSPRMPAFGDLLEPAQIRALVTHIRTLCQCAQPPWAGGSS